MFQFRGIFMNYKQVYQALIDKARIRRLEGYREIHHILPRCMGGSDNLENLIALTAREHFVAHLLLVKIYPEKPSLIYAVKMMSRQSCPDRSRNRMYEWLRIKEAQTSSEMNSGKGNAFYGKKHTEETKQKISEAARARPKKPKPPKKIWTPEMLSERQQRAAKTRIKNGNHLRSEASKEKMRQTMASKPLEAKQGGKKNLGKTRSQELKDYFSSMRKGQPAHNKGKKLSEEAKANIINGQRVEPYMGSTLCQFGCGQLARFIKPSGKKSFMCDSHHSRCPQVKSKKVSKLIDSI